MAVLTNFGIPNGSDTGDTNLMPKLKYRFRVTFSNFGYNAGTNAVTQNVINVTRPQLTQDEIIIDQYNSRIKVGGKHTWNDVTLTIRDDVSSKVIQALDAQMNRQVNHNDQSAPVNAASYKFAMTIETLDGSNDSDGVLDNWELVGCWISDINWGDLDYSASEVVQVQLTVKYDNASHHLKGVTTQDSDLLSQGPAPVTGEQSAAP